MEKQEQSFLQRKERLQVVQNGVWGGASQDAGSEGEGRKGRRSDYRKQIWCDYDPVASPFILQGKL